MLTIYRYDPSTDITWINETDQYPGRLDHKFVHEKYNVMVFEIIKEPEIIAIKDESEETGEDILDT